jgi:hypothetical protein
MRILLILALGMLAGCESRSDAKPTAAKPTPSKPTQIRKQPLQTLNIKLPLKALPALPKPGNARAITGYPGSQLRVGVVRSAKSWRAVTARSGARLARLKVDWSKQMVVYAVFTGQTNSLSFKRWVPPKQGAAELQINWSGIEPHYQDATPAVFCVVQRAGVNKITVKTTGDRADTLSFQVR